MPSEVCRCGANRKTHEAELDRLPLWIPAQYGGGVCYHYVPEAIVWPKSLKRIPVGLAVRC